MENNTTIMNNLGDPIGDGIAVFAITISSIGIAANSVLLYLFIADSFFRKMIYYFMLISCLTDLVANATNIVSYVMYLRKAYYTTFLCKTLGFLIYTSYGISIMNLSLIAIYRYLSVVRPYSKVYRVYKKRLMITGEIIIWMICIAAGLPDLIYFGVHYSRKICSYEEVTPFLSGYLIIFVATYYVLPSAIIVISYWRIIFHQRNYIRPGQSSISRQLDTARKDKLIKSIMIVSACYVLTTWPVFAFFCAVAISRRTFFQIQAVNQAYYWLGTISLSTVTIISALNPFLYFKFDENIRRSFRNQFLKGCANSYR